MTKPEFPFNLLTALIREYRGTPEACELCKKPAAYQFYKHSALLPGKPNQNGVFIYLADVEWRKSIQAQMRGEYDFSCQPLCAACMLRSAGTLLLGFDKEGQTRIANLWEIAKPRHFSVAVGCIVDTVDDEGDTFATTCPDSTPAEVGKHIQQIKRDSLFGQ